MTSVRGGAQILCQKSLSVYPGTVGCVFLPVVVRQLAIVLSVWILILMEAREMVGDGR